MVALRDKVDTLLKTFDEVRALVNVEEEPVVSTLKRIGLASDTGLVPVFLHHQEKGL